MGKLSHSNKLRMQTLREQELGAKVIISSYPYKGWKLSTVKKSAVESTTLVQPFCVNQAVGMGDLRTASACEFVVVRTFPLVGPTKL